MSQSDISFSFSIPVYNGEATIKETVLSILEECDDSCEVLVMDNASTDNTGSIVKELAIQNQKIRYQRNETNLGYDRNFHHCFKYAKGVYVWLIGDDDVLKPGALSYVKQVIKNHQDIGFIYVNYALVNRKTNKTTKERDLEIYDDQIFDDGLTALKTLKEYPNFISSMVFLRDAWMSSNCQGYFDTLYIQMSAYLYTISRYKSYAVAQPFVENRCRLNNLNHKPEFYQKYLSNFLTLTSIISENDLVSSNRREQRDIIRSLLARHVYRHVKIHKIMNGKVTPEMLIRLARFIYPFPTYWPVLVFVIVPRPIIYNLFRLKKKLRAYRQNSSRTLN
jgi:abequosyltransferase